MKEGKRAFISKLIFVIKQRMEPKVIYYGKWEQIFTALVAMPCFIYTLKVNII